MGTIHHHAHGLGAHHHAVQVHQMQHHNGHHQLHHGLNTLHYPNIYPVGYYNTYTPLVMVSPLSSAYMDQQMLLGMGMQRVILPVVSLMGTTILGTILGAATYMGLAAAGISAAGLAIGLGAGIGLLAGISLAVLAYRKMKNPIPSPIIPSEPIVTNASNQSKPAVQEAIAKDTSVAEVKK